MAIEWRQEGLRDCIVQKYACNRVQVELKAGSPQQLVPGLAGVFGKSCCIESIDDVRWRQEDQGRVSSLCLGRRMELILPQDSHVDIFSPESGNLDGILSCLIDLVQSSHWKR